MKNTSLKIYLDKLDYEYIETYSFRRGSKLDSELTKGGFNLNGASLILDKAGQLDMTAEKISTIKKGSDESREIIRIVNEKLTDIPSWMCAPFYRDALFFLTGNNQVLDTLNICFECCYMQDTRGNFIDADQKMYDELQLLLKSFGHNIQKNESQQLREKIKGLKKAK